MIRLFIKSYFEILLYLLLLLSVALHSFFHLPNFSGLFLLLPLLFAEVPLWRGSLWDLSILTLPLFVLLEGNVENLLNLSFYAFAEELFFRGFLMRRYSNLVVSFMFMLPHILLYQSILSALTFFPSLFFGFLYKRTGSLIFVSIVHFFSNVLYSVIIMEYANS